MNNDKLTYEELENEIIILRKKIDNQNLIDEKFREVEKLSMIGHWDYENGILTWSDEIFDIFGVVKGEFDVSAENFENTIHPEDKVSFLSEREKALKAGKNVNITHRIIKPNGEISFVVENVTIIRTNDVSIRLIGTVQDITERKQIEQAYKESEQRWKFALEGAGDGLWDWNLKTNEVFFSKQWKAMFGFEENEIKDSLDEWSKKVHPDDLQKCYSDIQLDLDGKSPFYSNTHRVLCKDGTYKWILDRGKIMQFDQNGKPLRMIGTHTDLTERFEIEKQLNQLNKDKDRFITILAHDLKSPFNSILGFLDLLTQNIRKYDIDKIENQINIVNSSAKNTFILLEDILMWIRANSGKIPFEPQKLNFGTICNEVVENLKLTANAKYITINYFATDEVNIFADKNMLNTVLRNLVSNSIKFTNKSGQIDIYAETNHKIVTITISDNGIGIDTDTLNNLFDISQKTTTDGTENEKGTGLGLLLCKEFVEKHSGKIWVESILGKGSDFKFTMPLCND